MNAPHLQMVRPNGLWGFNARLNDLAEALGGLGDLLHAQADAIPDEDDTYRPVIAGAARLVGLCYDRLLDITSDIADAEKKGDL